MSTPQAPYQRSSSSQSRAPYQGRSSRGTSIPAPTDRKRRELTSSPSRELGQLRDISLCGKGEEPLAYSRISEFLHEDEVTLSRPFKKNFQAPNHVVAPLAFTKFHWLNAIEGKLNSILAEYPDSRHSAYLLAECVKMYKAVHDRTPLLSSIDDSIEKLRLAILMT